MKIILKINNQEITVNYEEAEKLYKELDLIFGQKEKEYPVWPTYPVYPDWTYKPSWKINEFQD